jgi:hypothetical protein
MVLLSTAARATAKFGKPHCGTVNQRLHSFSIWIGTYLCRVAHGLCQRNERGVKRRLDEPVRADFRVCRVETCKLHDVLVPSLNSLGCRLMNRAVGIASTLLEEALQDLFNI